MTEAVRAVLFDVDGTLIDSNYLHVSAWHRAFTQVGHDVSSWRIHRAVGLDSDLIVDELDGSLTEDERSRVKDLHSKFYNELVPQLRPLPAARDLVRACHERGWKVVLATSAPQDEADIQHECLQIDQWLRGATSGEDVQTAKPRPDIVEAALEVAGVEPDEALLIGDTVWDVQAGARAGVAVIGLLSGGVSEAELREAGAIAVYRDADHLLERLDSSPLVGIREAS